MTPMLEGHNDSLLNAGISNGANSSVLHPSMRKALPKIVSASGLYMTTEDGRCILDASGGPAVACIGHGNEDVKIAICRQMDRFSYCHGLSYTNDAAERLAKAVVDSTGGAMSKATIMGSGSEAVEAAMKLARQYFVSISQSERVRFIARDMSFHGTTIGALSLTARHGVRSPFEPLLVSDTISFVSSPNTYRGMLSDENSKDYVKRLADELDGEFKRVGPGTVCAFVAETVSGSSLGCMLPPPGYFAAMKTVCDKYGALLILDEVICGMGRIGLQHAWQLEGVAPDIQTIAKGLGGGYSPIAMLLMNGKVVEGLASGAGFFNHGHTYGAHPVSCAAALEVQDIIVRDGLIEKAAEMGTVLGSALRKSLSDHPRVGDIRGRGLFWAIEFVNDKTTKTPYPPERGIARLLRQKGMEDPYRISFYPGSGTADGTAGDHILISPPYTVTEKDVYMIVDLVQRVIVDFFEEI